MTHEKLESLVLKMHAELFPGRTQPRREDETPKPDYCPACIGWGSHQIDCPLLHGTHRPAESKEPKVLPCESCGWFNGHNAGCPRGSGQSCFCANCERLEKKLAELRQQAGAVDDPFSGFTSAQIWDAIKNWDMDKNLFWKHMCLVLGIGHMKGGGK